MSTVSTTTSGTASLSASNASCVQCERVLSKKRGTDDTVPWKSTRTGVLPKYASRRVIIADVNHARRGRDKSVRRAARRLGSRMNVISTKRLRLVPVTSENAKLLWDVLQEPDLRDYQDLPDVSRPIAGGGSRLSEQLQSYMLAAAKVSTTPASTRPRDRYQLGLP